MKRRRQEMAEEMMVPVPQPPGGNPLSKGNGKPRTVVLADSIDPEIQAMVAISNIIIKLEPDQRSRVITWLADRFLKKHQISI